ncbi:MAG: glycosyl hydrolase [Chloroflexi bacterium]|nr:glycosyl hydrolase [Chloroflexota bacterium]
MMNKDILILGTRKGLIFMKRIGNEWRVVHEDFPGIPISYAFQDHRNGAVWACADHGHWGQKLHRSRDSGKTFEEIPTPKYPKGSVIFDVFSGGQEKPAALSYLWEAVPGGDDQPERLYLGTEPGGLFQSDDGGETFHLVEGLWNHESRRKNWFGGGRDQAGLCSLVVDPRDSDHLFAGISVGGVYESKDGGVTWHGRNKGLHADYLPEPYAEHGHDPHCLVASPSNPDVLWQQNHCGVFRSVDGGKNWTDISQKEGPVKFGFPIAVDEQDDQIAWVVPAISDDMRMAVDGALCVGRTEDGGQTWTELRNGLPQAHCFDIVFRHALDIDGEQLAFGTTTGNLFLSTNRGDNWECLSHYFPPIYSVRFA